MRKKTKEFLIELGKGVLIGLIAGGLVVLVFFMFFNSHI